ncbi:MAG: MFS transporter [Nitrososphaerota archaeon]|nr:MFS transporter [Nitrososphaerota archaeon]MDG7023123.1 MFS transporter [Nitrososphaerota archaeon]
MESDRRPGTGWIVVAAATGLSIIFGIFFSFGVFLDPLISQFGWSSALTSFVFSVYSLSYSLGAIMTGRLADRYGVRRTIGLGGVLITLALVFSSRADAIWELYLTFGVMGGAGAAAFWIPPTKAVIERFESSPSLNMAVSVVAVGTGAGTLLISPVAGFFIADYGWRTCYLLFALISAALALFGVAAIGSPRKSGSLVSGSGSQPGQRLSEAVGTRNFWTLFGMYVLGCGIARYTVLVYIAVYVLATGFPLQAGALCVGLIGGGSIFGRLGSGVLSRALRDNLIVLLSFVLQGVSSIAVVLSGNIWLVYSSAFVFGIGYGAYVPQFPLLTRRSFGMRSYGLVYGVISSGLGFGALIGPPVLGGLLSSVTGSYFLTFVLSGAFSLAAAAMALLMRFQD